MVLKFLILLTIIFFSDLYSQIEKETRAVWVSTNFRLDWPPPTFESNLQKQSLIEILDNIKSKNLNTVYFQVRSNGTLLCKSSFEPLSPYITGKVNGKADYDPLDFAIEQAHIRGLEIHAWVNVVRCFSGKDNFILTDSNHIFKRKPQWVVEYNDSGNISYWLDPGFPEVRDYLSNLITEIVKNYDIDGIQLDFLRYPGKNFNDSFSYNQYGNSEQKDKWRRENITKILESVYEKIKSIKPYVKVGVAPIGIYKNENGYYFEGYGDVYQDSKAWLQKGIVDYLVPQVYWGINDKPDFAALAKSWVSSSFNRNIIIGIAAYKNNVKEQIDKLIEYCRDIHSNGVSFFRYSNIKEYNFKSFSYKAIPSEMSWLNKFYPIPPQNLSFTLSQDNPYTVKLSWQIQKSSSKYDSAVYIALYNLPKPSAGAKSQFLLDIIDANKNTVTFEIKNPQKINYYFALKSLNRFWQESNETSNVIEIKLNQLSQFAYLDDLLPKPMLLKNNNDHSEILLFSKEKETVKISFGNLNMTERRTIYPGKNVLIIQNDLTASREIQIEFETTKKKFNLSLE
ncbi:glycoside hydrolase family 10 protein [Melioribacteraceae bacterium 4301-Me]|uniref:glycoside hydrolase family 10 protein n=1 Tax=Pyranulibacter aquaticus TaxID=3163344 RepID=UPI003595ABD5